MKIVDKPQSLISLQNHFSSLLEKEVSSLSSPISVYAKERFVRHGIPTNRHEDWKYTALNKIYKAEQIFSGNLAKAYSSNDLPVNSAQDVIIISAISQKIIGNLPKGLTVRFHQMDSSVEDSASQMVIDEANHRLSKTLSDDPMLALNQALCRVVVMVDVEKNTVIESPIVIDYGTGDKPTVESESLKAIQSIISLQQSAQATVIECHRNAVSQQELSLISCVFNLDPNAQCRHYSLTNQLEQNQHFWYGYGTIRKDAHLQSNTIVKGEQLARYFFCNDLNGEGAQASVNSAYLGENKQTLDIRTLTRHLQPNSQSLQLHQGLLDDQSNGVFNGMIYVDPQALGTDGQMDNNVILLTPEAQNNSKPQLEIYADDVKCSHGFTCGTIDKNQLYYMRSRGIPEVLARQHILKAFISKVTENFPDYLSF